VTTDVIVVVPATGGSVAVVQLSSLSEQLYEELQYEVPSGSFFKHEMGLCCAAALQKF
jgi:hypothetical protein